MPFAKTTIFLSLLASVFIGRAWSAEDEGREFENAKLYTIKIKASVAIPFANDLKGTSTGAGFIVDKKRKWAVTNAHVVSRSKAILQTSSFGTEFHPAKLIYADPDFDIAVIQIENVEGLSEANFECSQTAFVGLPVGAFGHPWDQSYTGTKGIVSGRTSELGDMFGDFLQTDAPINPGNSGGPLINLRTGKVIGINTAGITKAQNMNYAVPADEVCSVVNLLRKGVSPNPPESPFAFFKDTDEKNTLRISQIKESGKQLGAKIGDVIYAAGKNKTLVKNDAQMRNALRGEVANAELYVNRDGKEIILRGPMQSTANILSRKAIYFSELLIRKSEDKTYSEIFGQDSTLKVDFADAGGVGESRGVWSGDILTSIEGKEVNTIDEVYEALLLAKKSKDTIRLQFKRLSFEKSNVFTYRERTLPIGEITWVQFSDLVTSSMRTRNLASEGR